MTQITAASGLDQLAAMLTGDIQLQQKSGRDYIAFLTSGRLYVSVCCRCFVLEIAPRHTC